MLKNIISKIMNMNAEKIIIFLSFTLFFLLIIGQISMNFDTVKGYFSNIEVFEGHYIKDVDNLIQIGSVTLRLCEMDHDNDIKILVNGKQVSTFNNKLITVNVKDGSVIEIDGTKIESAFSVDIVDVSSNINKNIIGQKAVVESNIKYLTRVLLNIDY